MFTNPTLCNIMSVLDMNSMSWSSFNLTVEARTGYTATLHSDGTIVYTGGRSTVDYNYTSMNEIQIFDTNSFAWRDMIAVGATIGERGSHSAVLVNNSKIIIYGGSTTNLGIAANPEFAILDMSVTPFNWIIPNISGSNVAPFPSLTGHSAILYDDFMIIAFGRYTIQGQERLSNKIYIYDTRNHEWVISLGRNSAQQTCNNSSNSKVITIAASVCAAEFIACISVVGFILYRKKHSVTSDPNNEDIYLTNIETNIDQEN
ncbi:galactose oxidase [Gigaspora margarita]|uniref:Galactose oxidase n=1 Tax=Gigaspora margarita TaxID=4874 RepID=A0A8H3X656_GIGMA|nr:galactose oxidase [Gigaspora margarita]